MRFPTASCKSSYASSWLSDKHSTQRSGYTLLELLLALALTVLVSGLIGMLLQIYYKSSELSQSEVRQAQIARNILRMISDDLRSVVRYQEFDDSTLSSVLSSSAGGAGDASSGGAPTGGSSGASAPGSPSAGSPSAGPPSAGPPSAGPPSAGPPSSGSMGSSGGTSGSGSAASMSSSGSSGSANEPANTSDLAASTAPPPTPGLYGNQFELMIDVSRLPRPDQYYMQQTSTLDTQMPDVPSDIKSVLYYVQPSGNSMGIQDPLQSGSLTGIPVEASSAEAIKAGGGLVRRQLDRAVTQWANDQGQSDRLMRTGELLAPEVVSLEFNYFDGVQWLTQWDSSQQNLPMVVKIQVGMQDPRIAKTQPLSAGTPVSTMAPDQLQTYGIRVYELSVAIPGAQLMEPTTDSGMESMGL